MSQTAKQRKIYITQNDDDRTIFNDVVNKLEERGAQVFDIQGNHSEWEIINNISKCQFIWLVTENSVRGAGCTMEVMTVLERAFRENKINAVLLMYGDVKDQLLHLSVLDVMDKIQMELNPDGKWRESQVDDVLRVLESNKDLRSRFPAGNLSHGFAYSHFFGFHNVVLDRFEEKIIKSEWYKKDPSCMPLKIYELVPRTCRISKRITDEQERVKFVGELETIEVDRCGHKQRSYKLPVYTFNDAGKDYYFVAQFPNAISAMTGMKEGKLAKMDDVDIMVQLTRYYYTMDRLLNHPKNKHFNDKARLLLYNDEEESPYDVLRTAVRKDLSPEPEVECTHDKYNVNLTFSLPFEKLSLKGSQQDPCLQSTDTIKLYEACIVHRQNSRDNEIASKIEKALKQRGTKLFVRDGGGITESKSLQEAYDQSRWIILLLTQEALDDPTFFQPSWIASEATRTKSAMIIPVLVDISSEQIPDMLKWLFYLHLHVQPKESQRFEQEMDLLCGYIKGQNVDMSFENHLPAGNVGYGLAWGYGLNYFPLVLEDFPKYMPEAFRRENISDYTCPDKLYIMVPETCNALGLLDRFDRIEHCFKLGEMDDKQAGTNIVKSLDIYSVQDTNGKKYHFVGQFPTAIACLYEMRLKGNAGLNDDSMKREASDFCDNVKKILEQVIDKAIASRCQFLDFDDTVQTGLADTIIPKILQDSAITVKRDDKGGDVGLLSLYS